MSFRYEHVDGPRVFPLGGRVHLLAGPRPDDRGNLQRRDFVARLRPWQDIRADQRRQSHRELHEIHWCPRLTDQVRTSGYSSIAKPNDGIALRRLQPPVTRASSAATYSA